MNDLSAIARAPSRLGTGWGFAVMLLGMLCMMTPFLSGVAVNTIVAILMIAAGLTMTAYCFKAGTFGKGLLQFLFGGITILAGGLLLVRPMLGLFTMTAVLIAWFLVDGIFSIISGVRGKGEPGWGWIIVSGIASIVLAVLLWRQWPASGAFAVGLLVGIRLIFTGWSIAMLGMMGDATVDVVKEAVDEAAGEYVAEAVGEKVDRDLKQD
jgi:uncharacterized membrane protein HdeD (DUF308 family)